MHWNPVGQGFSETRKEYELVCMDVHVLPQVEAETMRQMPMFLVCLVKTRPAKLFPHLSTFKKGGLQRA